MATSQESAPRGGGARKKCRNGDQEKGAKLNRPQNTRNRRNGQGAACLHRDRCPRSTPQQSYRERAQANVQAECCRRRCLADSPLPAPRGSPEQHAMPRSDASDLDPTGFRCQDEAPSSLASGDVYVMALGTVGVWFGRAGDGVVETRQGCDEGNSRCGITSRALLAGWRHRVNQGLTIEKSSQGQKLMGYISGSYTEAANENSPSSF